MQALWWIILIISVVNCAALAGFVFPKIFFRAGSGIKCSFDRGLKNYKEKNGRSIAYEPRGESKKYINQYIISERSGKKVILCKLNANITYLDYDIVLFNSDNKVFRVLNVKENIAKAGYTDIIELPPQAMYATLIVNSTDNFCVSDGGGRISYRKLALCIAVTSVLIILEVFCIQLCFANIFGDVFAETFSTSATSFWITFGIGYAGVIVNVLVSVVYAIRRNRKIAGKPYGKG